MFSTIEELDTMCDNKASWERLEGLTACTVKRNSALSLFQTAIIVLGILLIFAITEFLKTLMQQVCLLHSQQQGQRLLTGGLLPSAMFMLSL